MTKKSVTAIIVSIAAAAGIGGFLYWDNVFNFTGDRLNNPDYYCADFTNFNGSEELTRELKKGEGIRFKMTITKGNVTLINHNNHFRTTGIEEYNDLYIADKDGTYSFTIKAKHAAGHIEISDVKE